MRTSRAHALTGQVVVTCAAALAMVPLIGVVIMALGEPDTQDSTIRLSDSFHFGNFKAVWDLADMGTALATSFKVSITATLLTLLLSVPAGYALARFKLPLRNALFFILLAGLMLPNESLIIPLFFDFREVGLADNLIGVVLVETALGLPFGCFWMRTFFRDAPHEITDAGRVDGANSFVILVRLLLPMAMPQLLALIVLSFVWTWNDLLVPLVMLSGGRELTAPMSLATFQGQYTTDYTYLSAGAILTALPVIAVYLVLQRSFAHGITSGAMKG
ncbi:carbohydrate ABC transporter permease [Dactylosporangium maewongense]|uniref:Carbohydrate ABC transporter permease n=2 Tax=Dactylosporangium maewongense TaxID=634393 RepID=A0ABN2C7U1_9ACTN